MQCMCVVSEDITKSPVRAVLSSKFVKAQSHPYLRTANLTCDPLPNPVGPPGMNIDCFIKFYETCPVGASQDNFRLSKLKIHLS